MMFLLALPRFDVVVESGALGIETTVNMTMPIPKLLSQSSD
jgi:hypothetical protein